MSNKEFSAKSVGKIKYSGSIFLQQDRYSVTHCISLCYMHQGLFFFFLIKKNFYTWTVFKLFIEFVTILLLFYVWCFGPDACGVLAPWPGIEPSPPALQGKVLTTGLPENTQGLFIFKASCRRVSASKIAIQSFQQKVLIIFLCSQSRLLPFFYHPLWYSVLYH